MQSLNPSGFTPQLMSALRADRAELLRNDVWRGLLFVGLALAALYFYLKGKLDARMARRCAGGRCWCCSTCGRVDKRYLGAKNFQHETIAESFQPSPADQADSAR
ncbi:MAG: hypothetical protein WKG07_05915 [Hymenobacter sp.]